jgi:hypothetical protein
VPKVHADSSNFAEGVTKEEAYEQVLEQAEALFEGQRNWVNFDSLLKPHVHTDLLTRSGMPPHSHASHVHHVRLS